MTLIVYTISMMRQKLSDGVGVGVYVRVGFIPKVIFLFRFH